MRDAEKIAADYRIILERSNKLGFIGNSVELPTVYADGKTTDECYKATQKALVIAIATIIECGQRPPRSSVSKKRDTQVNFRLTADERLLLSCEATNLGFKGISDFMRTVALKHIFSLP
ncbi:MAG: type II toxin-antitoxin system HicB family antitoxin [Planctomycetota bacterium]